MGRVSYIFVVNVIGPTIPIHSRMPTADPRAAVFALRHAQICASTNAISRFSKNVMTYGRIGFMLAACADSGPSSAIHGLLNSTAYQTAPSSQYTTAQTTTAA